MKRRPNRRVCGSESVWRRAGAFWMSASSCSSPRDVDGFVSELKDLVGECASLGTPLEVVAAALSKLVALRESEIVTTARIMRESAGLRARNQGKFLRLEQAIFDGLCEVWPDDAKRDRWRFTAMMSAGTLRFAVEAWGRQNGKPPLAVQIQNMFQKLQDAIRENL